MVREFKLPDVGEGVAEGELVAWHVEPGDAVTEDQVVAEVETDKAVVDVPAPVDGTVRELLAEPGDVIPVGDVIITFDVAGEDGDESGESDETGEADASGDGESDAAVETGGDSGGGRVFAPPSVRRLARELGVEITAVSGSGPGGRVTESDVRAAESGADSGGGSAEGGSSNDGLKSAVSRIDDSDESDDGAGGDGLKSAVSRINDGDGAASGDGDGSTGGAASAGDSADGGAAVEAARRDRTLAAPATRRIAEEAGVDIDDVPATEQRDGEAYVTPEAVREYAETQQAAQAADAAALSADDAAGGTAPADDTAAGSGASGSADRPERREPYRGIRRTIGEAMERSKFTAPHVTHHEQVDATGLVAAREKLKPRAEERGVRLTYMPFVMKAVVAALREHPVLNTSLDEDSEEIVYKDYYNVGVATATDAGLMVPVVEDVDRKGLLEVAAETNDLVRKARDRSIDRAELRGGTFTITNFGAIGGEYATPIINHPETAVLGLGEITERPVVEDGEVVARETVTLSLSVDHRVVDGADAARFVNTLADYLADPTLLLLE